MREFSHQLGLAQAEAHAKTRAYEKAQADLDKLRKQNNMAQSKLRESENKLLTMEGKLKEPQRGQPTPKPRSDIISQLKTEKTQVEKAKEELEMRVAVKTSELDVERRAREAAEEALRNAQEIEQKLLIKNAELISQLGIGGRGRGGGGGGGREESGGGAGGSGGGGKEREQLQSQSAGMAAGQIKMEARLKEVTRQNQRAEEELLAKSQEVQRLQIRLDSSQEAVKRHEQAIAELDKERKEAVTEKGKFSTKVAILEEELKSLRDKDGTGQKPKPLEKRLNDSVGKYKALEQQFEEKKRVSWRIT